MLSEEQVIIRPHPFFYTAVNTNNFSIVPNKKVVLLPNILCTQRQ
jgi:hypothetical protein